MCISNKKSSVSVVSFKKYAAILIVLIVHLIITVETQAQKVAVVLSGGGSRGTAHIGVLKALEENNIPIDCITGTSIGALVGGLYAAGYSPEEMEQIFVSGDFERWSAGVLNQDITFFFKKDDPDAGWVTLNLDFSKQFSGLLPTNFVSPTEMNFRLMQLFSGASAVANYDFNNLFVPFRCIASDIDSNKSVILSKGDLGKSIRASLTFPFYFKPIEIDDRLLFDGGMYNNFPADVAIRDFAPDFIIGSKVAGNYPKPDPDDILTQIQNMLMTDTDFSLERETGIIIEPRVEKVNLIDFSQAKDFIDSGYIATIRRMPEIKERVKTQRPAAEIAHRRIAFNNKKPSYIIDSISIKGLNKRSSEYVYSSLFHKSSKVTLAEISDDYIQLAADDKLKMGTSCMKFHPKSGNYELCMDIKPADHFSLKFGGNISSRLANQAFVELQYKYLFKDALKVRGNVYFGKFYTSVMFDTRIDFPSKNPYYLGANLVYNHYDYFKSQIHFFEDQTPSYLIQDDNYLRIYGGKPLTKKGKIEAGLSTGLLENEYYQTNNFTREDTADQTRFNFLAGQAAWELNSLNRKQYANSGARFKLSLSYIDGTEKYISGSLSETEDPEYQKKHEWVRLKLIWDNYFGSIGPLKLGFYGELNISNQTLFNNYTSSLLSAPAFDPVPEAKTVFLPYFRAFNYGAAGIKAVWAFSKNIELRTDAYLYQPYQEIIRNPDNTASFGEVFSNRHWMASGTVVYHTFLMPISFSVNYLDNPEEKIYVALNIGYILFNKRALE